MILTFDVDSIKPGPNGQNREETKRYTSDLTDEKGLVVEPFLPKTGPVGSLRRTTLCEVMNTLRYLFRSGCEWRMLPVERVTKASVQLDARHEFTKAPELF